MRMHRKQSAKHVSRLTKVQHMLSILMKPYQHVKNNPEIMQKLFNLRYSMSFWF